MILAPLPTPFDDAGAPDWGALAALAEALAPHVDGFLLFGSTGESVHLSPLERAAGLRAFRTAKPFWVGVIEDATPLALETARRAADAGAKGLLVTPPRYYGGGADVTVFGRYLDGLRAPGLPLWLYHVPQFSHVDLPLSAVESLAARADVVGIKDSSGVLGRVAAYASTSPALRVYTGHAPTFLGALALGAEGGILAAANLAAPGYRRILDAWRGGRTADAHARQRSLEPLGRLLAREGVVLVKQALRHLGLPAGVPRPPYGSESAAWPSVAAELERLRADGDIVVS